MKNLFFFICLLYSFTAFAQDSSWNAKFIVVSPKGYTDTVYFGCAKNGDYGYQKGLDSLLDTTSSFNGIQIIGYDSIIGQQLHTRCLNIVRDIKGFKNGRVTFVFFMYTDTFDIDRKYTYLKWEAQDFAFNNKSYKIIDAELTSLGPYLDAVDKTWYTIGSFSSGKKYDSLRLYETGFTNDCGYGFRLDIYFNTYTPVLKNDDINEVTIYPNPAQKEIYIDVKIPVQGEVRIYNSLGIEVVDEDCSEQHQLIDIHTLSSGYYTLEWRSRDYRKRYFAGFIKS